MKRGVYQDGDAGTARTSPAGRRHARAGHDRPGHRGKAGRLAPTVMRDLRDAERELAEQVMAALGGPPRPKPPRVTDSGYRLARAERGKQRRWWRQREVARLHDDGVSLREIGRLLDISPATALRDLRARDG